MIVNRLSDKSVITHVMVVVRDGDASGTVPMPLAEFAALLSYYGDFGEAPVRVASADQMAYRARLAAQRQGVDKP